MEYSISGRTKRQAICGARPIRRNVRGAPFWIGDHVRVTQIVDFAASKTLVGKVGTVEYFEYSCGCGQTYPGDPMIGVRIANVTHEFWKEELSLKISQCVAALTRYCPSS